MITKRLENETLWVEKYRPQLIDDVVLPEHIKKEFKDFVANGNMTNLLLVGGAGTGKTTIARALCNELDLDYKLINASSERNIDLIRTTITDFASTVSLNGKKKCLILDEADGLNGTAQAALRAAIEQFSNINFILTANFKNKLIAPLHSRLNVIEFSVTKKEKPELLSSLYAKIANILKKENVQFDKDAVKQLCVKLYPDNRKIINSLQRYSASGTIDSGILQSLSESRISKLISFLKDKDFNSVRKWLAENEDVDSAQLYSDLYEQLYQELDAESIPQLVIYLADYMYKDAFAVNKGINTLALLTEIMVELNFKE